MSRKYEAGYVFGDWIMESRNVTTGFFSCSCGSGKKLKMNVSTMATHPNGKECDCDKRNSEGTLLYNQTKGRSKYQGAKFGELTCTRRDSAGYWFLCSCGKEVRKHLMHAEKFGHCGCKRFTKIVEIGQTVIEHKKPVEIEFFQTPTPAKKKPVSCRGCKFDVTYKQQLDGKICNCDSYEEDENGNCISKVVDRLNAEYWDIRNGRKQKEEKAP